jgi:hypothetical protein
MPDHSESSLISMAGEASSFAAVVAEPSFADMLSRRSSTFSPSVLPSKPFPAKAATHLLKNVHKVCHGILATFHNR